MAKDFSQQIVLKVVDKASKRLEGLKRSQDKLKTAVVKTNKASERGLNKSYRLTMRMKRALVRVRSAWKKFAAVVMKFLPGAAKLAGGIGIALVAGYAAAIDKAKELRDIQESTKLAGVENTELNRERLFRLTKLLGSFSTEILEGGTGEVAKIINEFDKRVNEATGANGVGFSQEKADFFNSVGLDPEMLLKLDSIAAFEVAIEHLRRLEQSGVDINTDTLDNILGGGEQEALQKVIESNDLELAEKRKQAEAAYFSATDDAVERAKKFSNTVLLMRAQFAELKDKFANLAFIVLPPFITAITTAVTWVNNFIDALVDAYNWLMKKLGFGGTPEERAANEARSEVELIQTAMSAQYLKEGTEAWNAAQEKLDAAILKYASLMNALLPSTPAMPTGPNAAMPLASPIGAPTADAGGGDGASMVTSAIDDVTRQAVDNERANGHRAKELKDTMMSNKQAIDRGNDISESMLLWLEAIARKPAILTGGLPTGNETNQGAAGRAGLAAGGGSGMAF